jgi:hypothetical protein
LSEKARKAAMWELSYRTEARSLSATAEGGV